MRTLLAFIPALAALVVFVLAVLKAMEVDNLGGWLMGLAAGLVLLVLFQVGLLLQRNPAQNRNSADEE